MSEGLLVPLQLEYGIVHMNIVLVMLILVLRTKAVGCLCGWESPFVTEAQTKIQRFMFEREDFPDCSDRQDVQSWIQLMTILVLRAMGDAHLHCKALPIPRKMTIDSIASERV